MEAGLHGRNLESVQKHVKHLCKSDQEVLQNQETLQSMTLHFKEAFRISAIEVVRELKLLGKNWEVDLSSIKAPVEIWHGEEDPISVPMQNPTGWCLCGIHPVRFCYSKLPLHCPP